MSTVITKEALQKSSYRRATLGEVLDGLDVDEVCFFVFPSPSLIDQENGDGQLVELWDYARDGSWVEFGMGEIKTSRETEVWVR